MWIKRFTARNFGPHANLDVHLDRGLIGLFGVNGRGKSHIPDGIYAALTNDFRRFHGTKDECIRDTADPAEEAYLLAVGEHDGVEFEVFRRLRKAAADKGKKGLRPDNELKVGGRTWTKDPEIKAELQTHLGVNFALLDNYVFVPQREMFSFLTDLPSQRAATYQTLCGTQRAAQICKAIEAMLENDPTLTSEVIDDSDEVNVRIGQRHAQLVTAEAKLREAQAGLMFDDKLKAARAIVKKQEAYDRAVAELRDLAAQGEQQAAEIERQQPQYDKARATAATAKRVYDDLKPKAEAARAALKRIAKHNLARQRHKTVSEKLVAARAAHAKLLERPPALHPEDPERDKLVEELTEVRLTYQRNKAVLEQFDRDGVAECPTCGTPVEQMHDHLARMKGEQASLAERGKQLKGLIELVDACHANVKAHEKKVTDAFWAVQQHEQELEGIDLGGVDEDAGEADFRKLDEDFLRAERAYSTASLAETDLRLVLVRLQERHAAANDLVLRREAERDANVVKPGVLAKVHEALAQHEAARIAEAAAEQLCRSLREAIREDEECLAAVRAKIERNRSALRFADRLRKVKEVMHHQRLPQQVAQQNLRDVEEDVNAILDGFGSPFWVEAAEDLDFTVHFPGQPPRSAQRLSVGQKGVLAMAFRPALSSLFDAEIGMMTLDEPTADMDERNRAFMAAALARYAGQVRGRRQVIVITHADELRPAFDQVVDLDADAKH